MIRHAVTVKLLLMGATLSTAALACLASAPTPTAPPVASTAPAEPTTTSTPPATIGETPTAVAPPAAGWIVFTCQLFADARFNQICRMRPDGSSWQRITQDDFSDHFYPSPAGPQSLVYSANTSGTFDIYEWRSGVVSRLTNLGEAYAPAISPDGGRLAFTVIRGEQPSLWLAGRNGQSPQLLVADAWDATWSPDGARILHASDRDGTIQLWTVEVETAELQRVTNLPGLRGRSDWSADGMWLATYAGEPWLRELVMFDPAGGSLQTVTNGGNNLAPSFSPDGRWLTFTSYRDRYQDDNGCEVYVLSLQHEKTFRLTNNTYCDWQPRWGPG